MHNVLKEVFVMKAIVKVSGIKVGSTELESVEMEFEASMSEIGEYAEKTFEMVAAFVERQREVGDRVHDQKMKELALELQVAQAKG